MLKLKLQDFGHLMQRADSLEKTLMLGKIEGRKTKLKACDRDFPRGSVAKTLCSQCRGLRLNP